MGKKVFISYRREDTASAAGRLYDRFCLLLGKSNVFLDVGAIDAGENFEAKIKSEIGSSGAVLVLIGRKWMDASPGESQPRILGAGDHVRGEVRAGLQRNGLTLPLLVDGAPMPKPELLPEDIREIAKLNAWPLRHETFDTDADHIARKVLGLAPGELLWESKGSLTRKIRGALAGGGLAAALLLALALAHTALLQRPISASIGEAPTTILIAGVLIFGLIYGAMRGAKRSIG